MNPQHNSNQNLATASVQQVKSVTNQQMCNGNGGGLLPNNMPIAAPSCFMNFPNQPFPLQNTMGQFPNGFGGFNPQNFNPFPVNQFNLSQQQQGQFFANNPMIRPVYNQNVGLPNEQVIMQNTIQNITQLLQLQNPNFAQFPPGNFPMFQNQIPNVMGHQNPGFLANQQFSMPNFSGPLQHANQGQQRCPSPMMNVNASNQLPNMGQQLQGNLFLPHASGAVQTQQSQNLPSNMNNLQNQIAQGGGPQNNNFLPNKMLGMANSSGPVPHANQGQQRFAPPMMDVNASRQKANAVQTQNPTNFEGKHGNMPASVNAGWAESQCKNFTGDKRNDASHKGFNSQFHHAKHVNNGNMNRGKNRTAVHSSPRNSTNFERKVPSLKYTEQEIKQWREARKKHYPKDASNTTNQETMSRRQQLKEILAKQAELGCEVADIPQSYLSSPGKQNPRHEKRERERFKKGKFNNKRGTQFHNDRIAKKSRPGNQDDHHPSNKHNNNLNEREPSLLQKLLTRDIKRDQSHLLQVFRFMAVNSFFSGEGDKSLRFPSVIVRETGVDVSGEPVEGSGKVVDMADGDSDEEEGEITD